jgi:mRNA turnover protein 4
MHWSNLSADFLSLFLTPAVTLSQTKKKGRVQKESVISKVRACFDDYTSMYVFRYENMRNAKLKELRDRLSSSSRYGSNSALDCIFVLSVCV